MKHFYIVKEYIEYYLSYRRLTKTEFCKLCDIDDMQLYQILTNSEDFDVDALKKISDYIDVPIEKLFIKLDISIKYPPAEEG